MRRRGLLLLAALLAALNEADAAAAAAKPNIVLIFVDNLGNGDLHCFAPLNASRVGGK